jgi:hypothetical protein
MKRTIFLVFCVVLDLIDQIQRFDQELPCIPYPGFLFSSRLVWR